ncbi:hypothetical protein MKW98_029252 [Papaver atlanticum]|uniref:F-box domain-containing protein n=1 Tax=Papaver atlanticum TaxID=357466 RepID=A0AAD4SNN2_9MAGN|nr:hypothetical protein MKW98_029252 [Papaver atlanticum]
MVNLPWDILLDILVRLPLKSISRFRCVNHFWNNELKHTKFLRAQRRFSSEMDKFNLMLHGHVDIDTFCYDPSLFTCEEYSHVEYPVKSLGMGIEVFGCCYGLFLLRHVSKFHECVLMLWNPTTNECKRLPNPQAGTKAEGREYEEYGLGYSARIKDFKVVHLTEALQEGMCEVQVYSLKSNSWRRVDNVEIEDLYWHGMLHADAVRQTVGGAAHWLAYVEATLEGQLILRFEFETEEFDGTLLPHFNSDLPPILCALGNSLCYFIDDSEVTSLWELKINGEEKSWTKLFTIELTTLFGSINSFMPLKSLRNGKIVLGLNSDKYLHIVLYDPKHDTVEALTVYETKVSTHCISVFEESLQSLDTGTYLGKLLWEASQEEDENDKNEEHDDDDDDGDGEEE